MKASYVFLIFSFMFFSAVSAFAQGDVLLEQSIEKKQVNNISSTRDPFEVGREIAEKNMSESCVFLEGKNYGQFKLPKIKIKGLMVVGDKIAATADVNSQKNVILKEKDTIILSNLAKNTDQCGYFTVKELTRSNLKILINGKHEFIGKFR